MKYYCTFGPSCFTKEKFVSLFEKGLTGARLNLSHSSLKDSDFWIENFHNAAQQVGVKPELLVDMHGPELRLMKFDKILLLEGALLKLQKNVHLYEFCFPYFREGQIVSIDDGKLVFEVDSLYESSIVLQCKHGGWLEGEKSISIHGFDPHLPALNNEDFETLDIASQYGVTGIMQPFVRNVDDLKFVRAELKKRNLNVQIFAKIENQDGVDHYKEYLDYCDELIIARGDLGNSISLYEVPRIQKEIASYCKEKNFPFMVVTQLLTNMEKNATPTRAEVSDIYNAVLDGCSSLMLTSETAMGLYPIESVQTLMDIAQIALLNR